MSSDAGNPASQANADVLALRARAVQSITLAIELFNRPIDIARPEAVLIHVHHAFELLLKAAILEQTGIVFDEARGFSYSFDTCLQKSEQQLRLISTDDRRFLSMLDNLRDGATHYYLEVSERILYVFTQASVSLFNRLLLAITGSGLLNHLPARVLPISSIPPSEIATIIEDELEQLQRALRDSLLTKQQAVALLRPLMAFKIAGENAHRRMTVRELEVAVENLRAADTWRTVFPEIARVEFLSDGPSIIATVRVVKTDEQALPVRVIKPGDPVEPQGTIIEREINLADKFNMGLQQLAANLRVTMPRALAMVREYKIQEESECYREIKLGRSVFKRYSRRALHMLRPKLDTVDACWERHGRTLAGRRERQ